MLFPVLQQAGLNWQPRDLESITLTSTTWGTPYRGLSLPNAYVDAKLPTGSILMPNNSGHHYCMEWLFFYGPLPLFVPRIERYRKTWRRNGTMSSEWRSTRQGHKHVIIIMNHQLEWRKITPDDEKLAWSTRALPRWQTSIKIRGMCHQGTQFHAGSRDMKLHQ